MTRKHNDLIVKRSSAGLGLFTSKPIAARQRIIESTGTILSEEEAQKATGKYLYDIGKGLTLDCSSRANLARYINHSCEPNAEAYTNGRRVWIWSSRAIEAGEEITTDYGEEYFDQHIKPKGCRCKKCDPKKAG